MTDLAPIDRAVETSASTPLLELKPELATAGDPYQIYLDKLDRTTSRATMRGCLDRIARIVLEEENGGPLPHDVKVTGACRTWWRLRYEHTTRIHALLSGRMDSAGWSYGYVNKHLVALRRILKECWRLEKMTAEDYHRAIDIPSIEGSREQTGRSIHEDELSTMLGVCEQEDGPAAVRNAALVAVLRVTGIRRSEAAGALIERYDPGERALRIVGKRNKERTVYISPTAVPALDKWLSLVGSRKGPMFRRVDRWGNISSQGMTPTAVGNIVDKVRELAGLPALDTHDFRRTYAGDLLDAGVDLATVQKLMGHASPTTTAGYDRRPERVLRDASDRISLPLPRVNTETGERS
jgi:site-specific recombinase XerD